MDKMEGYFEGLNKYMDDIMFSLASSEKISKLLAYTSMDAYTKEPPTNPYELLYKNIFPFGYVPDLQNDTNSYITIKFDGFKPTKGGQLMYGFVIISVFTHEDLQRTNNGNRLLLLYNGVHQIMNNKDIGIGKLRFNAGRELPNLQKPYSGLYLVYELVDFNG